MIRVSMIDDSVVPRSNGLGLSSKYPGKQGSEQGMRK